MAASRLRGLRSLQPHPGPASVFLRHLLIDRAESPKTEGPAPSPRPQTLPCPHPCARHGVRIRGAGADAGTSACHPAGTLFLRHVKQLNSAAELWFASFSPPHLYILAKSRLLAKNSAAASKATPGWCHPMAASGAPLRLSPSSLWLSRGAVETGPGSAFGPRWHGAQQAVQGGRL